MLIIFRVQFLDCFVAAKPKRQNSRERFQLF